MVHKFHLNVAMKCAIVTGIQESSEATWMLATSLWRRNKNKTNQILTTLDGATYKGAIERGYAMSPNRSVSSSIVHPARLGRLMSWVVVALAFWVLTPEMAQAQTVLPNTINLPPSSLASPSVPPSASFSDMKRADLAVGNEVAHEVEVVPMAIPGVVPESAPQIAALSNAEVRATELRGLLPHQFDRHYFGLEAMQTGGAFAVTLVVEPATALAADAVNFVVLTDDGLKQFLAGVDPLVVKTAIGSPLLFDQIGNRLTALVPGNHSTGYTVIVYNNSKMPVSYALQVQGGLLRDDAGQTFSAILVNASEVESTATDSRIVLTPSKTPTSMLLPEPVRARRVSGVLMNAQDRHYLNLAADTGEGDITLTLRYRGVGDVPAQLNFWVMTQDGVRHLIQGALAQELNLATGLPVVGEEGVYVARLRIAQNMLYTVVLFNDGQSEADYALSVQGGILVDRYAQTREAQAAAMELMALGGK
jgi:hypothetical protein